MMTTRIGVALAAAALIVDAMAAPAAIDASASCLRHLTQKSTRRFDLSRRCLSLRNEPKTLPPVAAAFNDFTRQNPLP